MSNSMSCLGSMLAIHSLTGELPRCSRKRAQPFPLSHCRSEGNLACLPGLLWSSSWEWATHSVQATRWARTQSSSRSLNLWPNFNGSGSQLFSHAAIWEGLKRSPPLVLDIVLSEAMKGCWTQEVYEGLYNIRGQTVLHPSAYVVLRPLGLTWGEERYRSSFVSTLHLPTRISPSKPVFQWASGSPD